MARLLGLLAGALLVPRAVADCSREGDCFLLRMQKCPGAERWTIHGLWPQWKEECTGADFDIDALQPILSELQEFWPSCPSHNSRDAKFWRHEWEFHGTCSGLDLLEFFQTTLRLYQSHNSECSGDRGECNLCFLHDLSAEEKCVGQRKAGLNRTRIVV
mmetsp:Transcript_33802/g.96674  ORF Transcript_33802/g.96674 Transcript_33802/m.96674 type:complete len:159 (+) Transcript_33802:69-545(+)